MNEDKLEFTDSGMVKIGRYVEGEKLTVVDHHGKEIEIYVAHMAAPIEPERDGPAHYKDNPEFGAF